MHIGVDLTMEALWDTKNSMDGIEYGSVLAITVVMTLFGMTEGLALGLLCAAFTFTLQAGRHVPPIRGKMSAHTLRSSRFGNIINSSTLL
jgi:SulP family sulfate permease